MTWIDERLFGWSRTAKLGTSAWAGTSLEEPSHAGTPDESDEEDAGDYDHVIGLVPGHDDHLGSKSRSRNNSYANLQRLRLSSLAQTTGVDVSSAVEPSSHEDGEGLHIRSGHRKRSETLSDGVPVERLAAVDRREPFPEATGDLNEEIRQAKSG